MKMADGGFRPAYNVQLATDTATQIITGVDVSSQGSDHLLSANDQAIGIRVNPTGTVEGMPGKKPVTSPGIAAAPPSPGLSPRPPGI